MKKHSSYFQLLYFSFISLVKHLHKWCARGINSIIQSVKRRARGYGTTKHFINIVYLICSDLEFNLPTAFE